MGASVIEQIYLPNCLCASGIKLTKSQKSEGDWVFKLARSTYAQAGEISPRTMPGITANDAGHHRERCRGITANSPSPRASVLSAGPAIPHLRYSPKPCRSTPASFLWALPFHTRIIPLSPASSNLLPDTFCLFQS